MAEDGRGLRLAAALRQAEEVRAGAPESTGGARRFGGADPRHGRGVAGEFGGEPRGGELVSASASRRGEPARSRG
jgi:hypothetical protein